MNTEDKKYRFNEIMATLEMLPDDPSEVEDFNPLLPNGTLGLSEPEIFSAILCQSFKPTDDEVGMVGKMVSLLMNTAMESAKTKIENDDKPSADDLYAMATAANILWAKGAGEPLFSCLGILGKMVTLSDQEIPTLAIAFLRGNQGVERFGRLDPYKILEGSIDDSDFLSIMEEKG